MNLTATINDEKKTFSMYCKTDKIIYKNNLYENILINAHTPNDTLLLEGKIDKIMNNGQKLSLDLNLSTINDKLLTEIKWNNNQSKPFLGSLNAETRFIKMMQVSQTSTLTSSLQIYLSMIPHGMYNLQA